MKADNEMTEMTHADVVDALARGPQPVEGRPDRHACPVCGTSFEKGPALPVHMRQSHVRMLPHEWQVQLPDHTACPVDGCLAVITTRNMANHLREKHRIYRDGERPAPAAVEKVEQPTRPARRVSEERAAGLVSATEAGLAVLLGLAPDGAVPASLLPEVVEWLATGERLVAAMRES